MERKYAITKIEAGDYILPSNDAKTLWRIQKLGSVGGSEDNVEWDWSEAGWYVSKYNQYVDQTLQIDVDDWSFWTDWSGPYATRAEAVKDVIR